MTCGTGVPAAGPSPTATGSGLSSSRCGGCFELAAFHGTRLLLCNLFLCRFFFDCFCLCRHAGPTTTHQPTTGIRLSSMAVKPKPRYWPARDAVTASCSSGSSTPFACVKGNQQFWEGVPLTVLTVSNGFPLPAVAFWRASACTNTVAASSAWDGGQTLGKRRMYF